MTPQLELMFKTANKFVEKHFRAAGEILPMYHAERRNGEHMILPAPPGPKDQAMILVRAFFELHDIVRYIFIDEAWIVIGRGDDPRLDLNTKASTHPDRREIVMFSAEDETGQYLGRRFILRPEHGPAKLSPLTMAEAGGTLQGRMIGLLPQRGSLQ